MSNMVETKLRKLPCIKDGICKETEKDMKKIAETFNKPEKRRILDVMNSYIHNEKDPSFKSLPHDNRGYSALHLAAEKNIILVAEKLLESGFDPLTPGCKTNTCTLAIHVAIEKGFDQMSALIIRHMATADVREMFLMKPENSDFVKCKRGRTTNKESKEKTDVLCVNHLIERDSGFVNTIQAIFDSLKDVFDNGLCKVNVKMLEEDNQGLVPTDKKFDYQYKTVFHNLTKAQKEVTNHPVIGMLIDYKWNAWGRRRFALNFFMYLVSLLSLMFSIVTAVIANDVRKYDTSLQQTRAFFEICVCIIAFYRVLTEVWQMIRHKIDYWKHFFNWIELFSTGLIFCVVLLRYTTENAHWFVLAGTYLLWVLRIFKYAAVSSQTGAYAESLRQILTKNFVPFSLLFIVVNVAFGGVFLLVLKGEGSLNTHEETSTIYGIWFVGLRTLIEAGPIVEYTGSDGYGSAGIAVILVFMAMTIVVLLNILIAQLTDTYSGVQSDALKSVRANRVAILVRLERNEWRVLSCLIKYFGILRLCCCNCFEPVRWKSIAMSNRKKHYQPVFENIDLQNHHKSYSTLNKDIKEEIQDLRKLQIKTDLKTQTLKSRIRELDRNMDVNFEYLNDIMDEEFRKIKHMIKKYGCKRDNSSKNKRWTNV